MPLVSSSVMQRNSWQSIALANATHARKTNHDTCELDTAKTCAPWLAHVVAMKSFARAEGNRVCIHEPLPFLARQFAELFPDGGVFFGVLRARIRGKK